VAAAGYPKQIRQRILALMIESSGRSRTRHGPDQRRAAVVDDFEEHTSGMRNLRGEEQIAARVR
jgi:hypothetical protein